MFKVTLLMPTNIIITSIKPSVFYEQLINKKGNILHIKKASQMRGLFSKNLLEGISSLSQILFSE